MLVSKLGEFGLIEKFRKSIKTDSSVIKGSGDDCAVLAFDKHNYQLFTCDMIVEGVDFTPQDDRYWVGRKALSVSISDIAACGGIPRYCVVSLGMTKDTRVNDIDKIRKGFRAIANKFNVNVVGGDISRAPCLVIDVSVLGIVEKECLALRSGAQIDDRIFVTGSLGGSIRGKHLKFTPRIKESRYLVKNYMVHSMIDVSDGLAQDLHHIVQASNAGAVLYETLIPVSKDAKGLEDALTGGEDFELIFTLPPKEAKKLIEKNPLRFKMIGEIVDKKYGVKLLDKNGIFNKLTHKGFQHF